ncbi:MAG TPA: sugar ABC transporter ATP-binding protein [Gaiellaceae bacterium]
MSGAVPALVPPEPLAERPLLRARAISKSFGGTRALIGVDLDLRPGEVHALIGQNGSGKSTLIKILSGFHAPDEGEVEVDGAQVHLPLRPGDPERLRLSFLHQESCVAERMSVLENLRLGRYQTTWYGRLAWRRERERVRELLGTMSLDLEPDLPMRRVPQAERALIGFVRAAQDIHDRGGVLILDEPTESLPAPAVERLFEAIRVVARRGSAVLFVSHRLEEVLEISDRISVIRDGRLAGTLTREQATEARLIELMLGRELGQLYPSRVEHEGEVVLQVRGLGGAIAQDVDLDVHRGEIVGLTGLVGMGHDEVPYLVFGARTKTGGTVAVDDRTLAEPTPEAMRRAGVALLPADRARASGVGSASVLENMTLPVLDSFFARGRIRRGAERARVLQLLAQFDVTPRDPDARFGALSGGNQQKALLGKWLQVRPSVLLLHEPTQGVDIGSRKEIFRIIREVAALGAAVVIASSEYEDLAHLCNRVVVMRRGRVVTELSGDDLTSERILERCYATT